MADAYNMINITQREFEELVGQYTPSVCESKQRMISEDRPQPHGPTMQNCFMTQTTQAPVAMHNLNLLPNHNVPEYREEGKYGWESRVPVHDKKGDMVDFEAIREISYASSTFVGMGNDDDLVSTVYEFAGELVDMTLDATRLWEEEIANDGNVVGDGSCAIVRAGIGSSIGLG